MPCFDSVLLSPSPSHSSCFPITSLTPFDSSEILLRRRGSNHLYIGARVAILFHLWKSGYHDYVFILECPRHNYNVLLKVLSTSSFLYSSDHPGNWLRISINIFALSDSSSSLTGIVIVLYHLISFPFTTGPGHVNVVSILGKMRRLVST